ncbi:ABC transporter ATP-binding protein [Marinobacter zhejiangensis]|uniref:Cu-processing system ATP-binding protein n=1 Tax=Marinobacter zhejiangensis TaxID=488535 RepID=A0A1I4SWX1_9GAMM|nr:ABC transporter ATP-binding protein [Marinobacter zhejiangensis]SFM68895.1 Cu-processing system ATP-binding protein [Marinobacter zhejiangensis]
MNSFELNCIEFGYGRQPLLRDITLTLAPGRIMGLFGHNGAGKTTTIKLILGLMAPQRGSLSVLGGQAGTPAVARQIGYLPENVMFYPQMTGREILDHFARLKGAARSQVPQLLEQVGLEDACNRRVKTYSKGMRQRLGLAQALLADPRLLILDEPTVGLDPVATAELYRLLRCLRNRGTGIVLCSHVLPGVEPYIDQAAILFKGRLQALGDLPSLRARAELPVRLIVRSADSQGTLTRLNGSLPRLSALVKDANTIELVVAPGEKMAAIQGLLGSGLVEDLQIHQPTLEDLYCHFMDIGSQEGQ